MTKSRTLNLKKILFVILKVVVSIFILLLISTLLNKFIFIPKQEATIKKTMEEINQNTPEKEQIEVKYNNKTFK